MARGQEQRERLEDDVQALTVRLPQDEYQALRTYAFVTKRSINDVVRSAVLDYLAGTERQQEMDAIIEHIRDSRRVALDKLAGM